MRLYAGSELGFLFGKYANNTGSNFMMNNCFVVFTDNINTKFLFEEMNIRAQQREGRDETYDNVTGLELERFRFCAFWAKPFTVDKGTV